MKKKNNIQPVLDENKEKSSVIAAQRFVGPIPPPEIFKQYGEIVPDAPERILKVFEEDSQHTRTMQSAGLKAEVDRDRRAQWMAFVIMLAALVLTGVAIVFGQNIAPGIITGLATLFLALKVLFPSKGSSKD